MYVRKVDVKGSYPVGKVREMCREIKKLAPELATITFSKFFEL